MAATPMCGHVRASFSGAVNATQRAPLMSLAELLRAVLPLGAQFEVLHVASQAYQCRHLIHEKPAPKLTLKVKHFFALGSLDYLLLGVEINVYISCYASHTQQRVFVSKADTTGLTPPNLVNMADVVGCFLQYLLAIDVRSYTRNAKLARRRPPVAQGDPPTAKVLRAVAERMKVDKDWADAVMHYKGMRVTTSLTADVDLVTPIHTSISLFTRAERQYLFPESYLNPQKHVIDGKQLLSWWLRILNQVLGRSCQLWACKVAIPGADANSVSKFYDTLPRYSGVSWSDGSIYSTGEELAINHIPLFPDDPKGRFLEHLVVENRYKTTTCSQFWQELGFRQEFRLGNLVGIIGCEQTSGACEPILFLGQVALKYYKAIVKLITGENYSDASADLLHSTLPRLLRDLGAEKSMQRVVGSKHSPVRLLAPDATGSTSRPVQNLTGLIKRRKK